MVQLFNVEPLNVESFNVRACMVDIHEQVKIWKRNVWECILLDRLIPSIHGGYPLSMYIFCTGGNMYGRWGYMLCRSEHAWWISLHHGYPWIDGDKFSGICYVGQCMHGGYPCTVGIHGQDGIHSLGLVRSELAWSIFMYRGYSWTGRYILHLHNNNCDFDIFIIFPEVQSFRCFHNSRYNACQC
jgi:hypothetical protein